MDNYWVILFHFCDFCLNFLRLGCVYGSISALQQGQDCKMPRCSTCSIGKPSSWHCEGRNLNREQSDLVTLCRCNPSPQSSRTSTASKRAGPKGPQDTGVSRWRAHGPIKPACGTRPWWPGWWVFGICWLQNFSTGRGYHLVNKHSCRNPQFLRGKPSRNWLCSFIFHSCVGLDGRFVLYHINIEKLQIFMKRKCGWISQRGPPPGYVGWLVTGFGRLCLLLEKIEFENTLW